MFFINSSFASKLSYMEVCIVVKGNKDYLCAISKNSVHQFWIRFLKFLLLKQTFLHFGHFQSSAEMSVGRIST